MCNSSLEVSLICRVNYIRNEVFLTSLNVHYGVLVGNSSDIPCDTFEMQFCSIYLRTNVEQDQRAIGPDQGHSRTVLDPAAVPR